MMKVTFFLKLLLTQCGECYILFYCLKNVQRLFNASRFTGRCSKQHCLMFMYEFVLEVEAYAVLTSYP